MLPEQHPLLGNFWPRLTSWSAAEAARAVRGLRLAIEETGDESPGPLFAARLQELETLVVFLIRSPAVESVLGGIRLLEALVQVAADGRTSDTALSR